jgi:hypothetical protein
VPFAGTAEQEKPINKLPINPDPHLPVPARSGSSSS